MSNWNAEYKAKLKSLCLSQLRVGTLGFGGPLATMSMMREELVTKKKLVSASRYLEGLGVVKLLPGPVSAMLAIFLGQEVAGTLGGLLSGLLFILPSFLILLGICYLEILVGPGVLQSEVMKMTFSSLQAAVIGIILYMALRLLLEASQRTYGGQKRPLIVFAFAVFAAVLGHSGRFTEIIILLISSVLGFLLIESLKKRDDGHFRVAPLSIFLCFFNAGFTVFGTGYMVLPFLNRTLVQNLGWLENSDFLNAVAYGNLTPGPILIASTYMGFKIADLPGALAATAGIFAGPFVLMLTLGPLMRRFLGRSWIDGVLMGLLPTVAVTIGLSLLSLGQSISWNWFYVLISIFTLVSSFRGFRLWKSILFVIALSLLHSQF